MKIKKIRIKKKISQRAIMRALYLSVLLSFILPAIFVIYRIIVTQHVDVNDQSYRSRADYVLILVQCLIGIIVLHIPSFAAKKLKFYIPTGLYFAYIIFLYCSVFLGEVQNFYYKISHWDDILHCMTGVLSGLLGFMMIAIINRDRHINLRLSPMFVAVFAYCFAMMIGATWEIYEFTFDGTLGLNMQKFRTEAGVDLVGRAALEDTMTDLIIDSLGALGASIYGYFSVKRRKGWVYAYLSSETGAHVFIGNSGGIGREIGECKVGLIPEDGTVPVPAPGAQATYEPASDTQDAAQDQAQNDTPLAEECRSADENK